MSILPIRIYPDPVLRVRCPEVESFDDDLDRLVSDMIETMHAAPGVGLAAPQVGVELRLAVVDPSVGDDPSQLHVLINPRIVEQTGRESDSEGCLSLPGITDKVDRSTSLQLTAQGVDGRSFELEAEGFLARAIFHEIDHLDGVLFVDRLRGLRRERARRRLKRLAAQRQSVSA